MSASDLQGDRKRGAPFDSAIMSAMAAASLDALITIDGEGLILEFGPAAERIFGYRRAEVLGRPIHEIVIPERLRQAHQDGMRRYHATGMGAVLNKRVEVPAQRRDGTEFAAELTVIPIQVGEAHLFTAFVRDISEQKATEAAKQQALEAAQEADAAKSRFLAHMSHELRTPLTGVLTAAELLVEAEPEQRALLTRTIQSSGRSLLRTVDQVLEFTRVSSGAVEIRVAAMDLPDLLRRAVKTATDAMGDKPVEITLHGIEDLPARVSGDAAHLRQVLDILLDNAVRFTQVGQISVHAGVTPVDGAAARLRIEVRDTGIGIDEEIRPRLFTPFGQSDSSDRAAYGGTGLGLTIARGLVEQMGGQIGFDSIVGKGSTFWFELALTVLPTAAPATGDTPKPLAQPDAPLGLNVLLVEDTVSNQLILGALLTRLGCTVTVAGHGEHALARLSEQTFDVVLMDLRMPVLDGPETSRRIRQLDTAARDVPIIGLTANAFAEDERRCRDAGMDDFLTKPVRAQVLRAHLERARHVRATAAVAP